MAEKTYGFEDSQLVGVRDASTVSLSWVIGQWHVFCCVSDRAQGVGRRAVYDPVNLATNRGVNRLFRHFFV